MSTTDTDTTAHQDTSSGEQVKVKSEDSSVDTGGNDYEEEDTLDSVNKDLTNDEKDGIDTENKDEKTDVKNAKIPKGKRDFRVSCPVCRKVCENRPKLNFHMRKHLAEPVCYLCGKRLSNIRAVRNHVKAIHKQQFYQMKPEHATSGPVSSLSSTAL